MVERYSQSSIDLAELTSKVLTVKDVIFFCQSNGNYIMIFIKFRTLFSIF